MSSRVERLVSLMTLEEKVSQLMLVPLDALLEGRRVSREKMRELLADGIGAIRRAAGSPAGLRPREVVEAVNEVQRFLVGETRLGIPAIVREESLAGLMAPTATAFPQAIGLASTWDPELVEEVAGEIRRQMLTVGARQSFAPVLDLCLDPRWGRCEETYGEDPYLAAAMGLAYVRGLQGGDLRSGVVATPKHFAGHGWPEGGRNRAPLHAGPRELREVHLFPFEVAVRVGGARSVMAAYHDIDGVPCHASRWLLTDLLRGEWGFRGYVVSDGAGVELLVTMHRVARDCEEAAALALRAGVDSENALSVARRCFASLVKAVEDGRVPEALVDEAVRRVLSVKEELGLFENPLADATVVPASLDSPRARALARRAAVESIVMLKNDGALPLRRDLRSLAVIGPGADDRRALLGDYHYAPHYALEDPTVEVPTILEALRSRLPGVRVSYARGCDYLCRDPSGFDEAERLASESDAAVLVLGERSGLDPAWRGRTYEQEQVLSGENVDRDDVSLPGLQAELARRVARAGRPTVLVLLNGRPLSIAGVLDYVDAVLEAWYPGEEGANAIADVLLGDEDPGGRLPVTVPRGVGQLPVYYYMRPLSWAKGYLGEQLRPLFPFGYGLSYAKFEYGGFEASPERVGPDGEVVVSLTVRNASDREGKDVVQLYVSRPVASVARPARLLRGFAKVRLGPGESARVEFRVPVEALGYYDEGLRYVVEEGEYVLEVGRSSQDVLFRASVYVTSTKVFAARSRYLAEARVVRA